MSIDEDTDFTQSFPQEAHCRMEVTTVSGQRLVAQTAYPKGHQHNPLSDADIESKFRRLAGEILTEQRCHTVLELLWSVERLPNLSSSRLWWCKGGAVVALHGNRGRRIEQVEIGDSSCRTSTKRRPE
jgi:hypothetical protein